MNYYIIFSVQSGCNYAASVLCFALGLPQGDSTWRDLFDVVICSANKPQFFSSNRPFRKWNLATNGPSPTPVSTLEKNSIYVNGSAGALKKAKGWSGKSVMYVGDNLWADLVEARRSHGWQTTCLINELAAEIDVQNTEEFHQQHLLRSSLRKMLNKIQPEMEKDRKSKSIEVTTFDADSVELINGFQSELRKINWQISSSFNPYFGSMFRTEGNLSIYAFSMRRYKNLFFLFANTKYILFLADTLIYM